MLEIIKKIFRRYSDVIPYAIFGVLTTIINIVVYWISAHTLNFGTKISTIIAWIVAVMFAYLTNRKWVFFSKAKTVLSLIKEITYFYICRLATGLVDFALMFIFVDSLNFNDLIIKIISNIIVIILNYVASKLIIFKNK